MNQLTTARARLDAATGLAATLDAAYDAFESILAVLRQHQERSGPGFPAFVLAAAAAGNGRDWIAGAPALPPPSASSSAVAGGVPGDDDWQQAAAEVAALADMLAGRLEAIAVLADEPRDQAACRRSASCAARIGSLLAGARPQ